MMLKYHFIGKLPCLGPLKKYASDLSTSHYFASMLVFDAVAVFLAFFLNHQSQKSFEVLNPLAIVLLHQVDLAVNALV